MQHRRGRCNANAASASDTRSVTADTQLGASRVGALTSPVIALPLGDSHSAVAAGATTQRTTVVAPSGKRQKRRLRSGRLSLATRAAPLTILSPRKLNRLGHLPSRWT